MKHGHTIASMTARCLEDGDCLLWTGAKYTTGAARAQIVGTTRSISARRLWLELHGVDMENAKAHSTCGNPLCLAHAVKSTPSQIGKSTAERTGYARSIVRRKKISEAKRKTAKLTLAQVDDIRNGGGLLREKAARNGVSKATAGAIVRGERWADYSNPFLRMVA